MSTASNDIDCNTLWNALFLTTVILKSGTFEDGIIIIIIIIIKWKNIPVCIQSLCKSIVCRLHLICTVKNCWKCPKVLKQFMIGFILG